MGQLSIIAALLFASATSILVAKRRGAGQKPTRKALLIGDLHESPDDMPLLNWSAWSASHGPVASGNLLFGTFIPIILLNTLDAASYFLSRKGGHCNNRPASVSMEMLTGVDEPGKSRFTLMHDYDENLKLRHRILTPSLGPLAEPRYQAVMGLESRQLLVDLLGSLEEKIKEDSTLHRDEIHLHLERALSSVILSLHYGIRVHSAMDPILLRILEQHKEVQGLAASPWLVDLFPALRHLPYALSPWRRAARAMFLEQKKFNMHLLERARASQSWNAARQADAVLVREAEDLINNDKKHVHAEQMISDVDMAYMLATSVEGAMETVSRQILWVLIAAATHPKALHRAQNVLDSVVGRSRLPQFSNRSELRYIDAFVSETMRWRPIAALGIPRRTGKADVYGGVKVAEGVTIVANSWAMGRDPVYASNAFGVSDVEDFVPERWLEGEEMDLDVMKQGRLRNDLPIALFGQGRRGCLGQRVALDGMFLHVAMLLWAFDIGVVEGEEINSMSMEVSGFMVLPAKCKLVLKPRGDWVMSTIQAEWKEQEMDVDILLGKFDGSGRRDSGVDVCS